MGRGESEAYIQTIKEHMRFTGIFSVVASIVMCWGCSNSAEAVKNDGAPNAAPTVASKPTQTANVNMPPPSIGMKPREKKMVDAPTSGPPPALQFRKADEDSEIATSMNARGEVVETRVFKSHPQIVRAEAVWKSAKEATLKITLRDGKMIDVKSDSLANLQTATTRDLMEIAGIQTRRGQVETRSAKKRP